MKIVCVAGGSYKSFYLNHLVNLRKADMLVFNFGIIYDYVQEDELLGDALVTKELLSLSRRLNATVVAGVFVVMGKSRHKAIIVSDGDKIHIFDIQKGAKIQSGNHTFVIGDEHTDYRTYHKIVLTKTQIRPNVSSCSKRKILIFCDKFGVNVVLRGKFERIFNKYSKIILK